MLVHRYTYIYMYIVNGDLAYFAYTNLYIHVQCYTAIKR